MKAKIVNLDGNYSEPVSMEDETKTTTNVQDYMEYHRPYSPKDFGVGYEVTIIEKDDWRFGTYPEGSICVTSDEPNMSGVVDWWIGLLPENLQMLGKIETPKKTTVKPLVPSPIATSTRTTTYVVKPYKEGKDEAFGESGLPVADKEQYEEGWEEQRAKEEKLKAMANRDYDALLGEATEIINFNGMMTMMSNPAHNGKMTEFILGQIMYGYAPMSLGIGYEVNIIDYIYNPDPENFVVVSSKETVPMNMANPTLKASGGHWALYLRKENLKMFLPPEMIEMQESAIVDSELTGKVSEVVYDGYVKLDSKVSVGGRQGNIQGRGRLCVKPRTGELRKMETREKGWMFVENVLLEGSRIETHIYSLSDWAKSNGITILDEGDIFITLETPKAKTLAKQIDRWDFFDVKTTGNMLTVNY